MAAPAVSIVVPNYNGRDLLARNLPSVRTAAAAYAGDVDIVVVDDGSTDESVTLLKTEFPDIRCVVLPENRGFQKAVDAGVEAAAHDLVLLLNTDVVVFEDFIAPLVKHFERPDTFAVGSLALQADRVSLDQNIAIPFMRRGTFRFEKLRGGKHVDVTAKLDAAYESLYVVGGHCLIDRVKYRELGGFDPLYEPFYYEEIDLCYRAWKRGWSVWFEPRSLVVHDHKGTIGKFFGRKFGDLMNERNRFLFTWKNLTSARMFRSHLRNLCFKVAYKWLMFDGSFYRALFHALGRAPMAFAGRRREHTCTSVSDEAIFERIGLAWTRLQAALHSEAA